MVFPCGPVKLYSLLCNCSRPQNTKEVHPKKGNRASNRKGITGLPFLFAGAVCSKLLQNAVYCSVPVNEDAHGCVETVCPAFGGLVRAPAPSSGGGGGGSAGPGAAVLPHGGSQGPEQGHGRATEEGT